MPGPFVLNQRAEGRRNSLQLSVLIFEFIRFAYSGDIFGNDGLNFGREIIDSASSRIALVKVVSSSTLLSILLP